MIPNWIEVTDIMRGPRMINLNNVGDFYKSGGLNAGAEITTINLIDGDRCNCRESYHTIARKIEERRQTIFDYLDKLLDAIRGPQAGGGRGGA